MRHISATHYAGPFVAGASFCGITAGPLAHRASVVVAAWASWRKVAGAGRGPLCRPAQRGAEGAGKSVVTDYRFAGPGYATRKLVGWGGPQTPLSPLARGATA